MKKALAVLSACSLTLALAACGGTASSSSSSLAAPSSSSVASSSSKVASVASSSVAPAAPSGDLSDDIRSQQVEINGAVYTFPVASVQEFLDNGWSCEKPFDFTVPSMTQTSGFTLKNSEGNRFVISFVNQSNETLDVMECQVYSTGYTEYDASKGGSFLLPGGIQLGSSYEEVIAAYGEPDDENIIEDADIQTLNYGSAHNEVVLNINTEKNAVYDIYVTFLEPAPDAAPASASSSAAGSTAAPAAGTADLSDSLAEPLQVSLDGAIFSFPGSTFADFVAAGWTIDPGAAGATLPANTSTRVAYTKGGSSIEMSAINETAKVAPIEEAAVGSLVFDTFKIKDLPVLFPGGIAMGASPEEIEAAYGSGFEPYDNAEGERLSMEYKFTDSKIKFQFFEGGLNAIDLRC